MDWFYNAIGYFVQFQISKFLFHNIDHSFRLKITDRRRSDSGQVEEDKWTTSDRRRSSDFVRRDSPTLTFCFYLSLCPARLENTKRMKELEADNGWWLVAGLSGRRCFTEHTPRHRRNLRLPTQHPPSLLTEGRRGITKTMTVVKFLAVAGGKEKNGKKKVVVPEMVIVFYKLKWKKVWAYKNLLICGGTEEYEICGRVVVKLQEGVSISVHIRGREGQLQEGVEQIGVDFSHSPAAIRKEPIQVRAYYGISVKFRVFDSKGAGAY
ncbi:hypothetical protein LXL04_013694 [Taraxacum kok-saghyz]